MRKLLTPLLLGTLMITNVCFSQSDYRSGYIITNNSDTIFGLINYNGNKANAKVCQFKKDAKTDVVPYQPHMLQAFRFIDGKCFVSKSLDTTSYKKIFLEYLINATVDIYYYRDGSGEHYLLDSGDTKLMELRNGDIEMYVGNDRFVRKDKSYIGVLKLAFSKSPTISKKVENISLNHQSLINVAKKYHDEVCSNESCIVYEKSLPKVIFSWGPVITFNNFHIINHGDGSYRASYLNPSRFSAVNYPSFGLFARKNVPYVSEHFFLSLEATYGRRTISTVNEFYAYYYDMNMVETFTFNHYDIKYTQSSLNTILEFRYEMSVKKIKPVFHAGWFTELALSEKYSAKYKSTTQGDVPFMQGKISENSFSKLNYGPVIGLGGVFRILEKEILVDLNYCTGINILNKYDNQLSMHNFMLSLKYAL